MIARRHHDHRYSDVALFVRLLQQARPYWLHIAGLFVLGLLSTPLALLQPVPIKITVDSVLGGSSLPLLVDALLPATGTSSGLLTAASRCRPLRAAEPAAEDRGQRAARAQASGSSCVPGAAVPPCAAAVAGVPRQRGASETTHRVQYDATRSSTCRQQARAICECRRSRSPCSGRGRPVRWQLALVAVATAPPLSSIAYWGRSRLRPRYQEAAALERRRRAPAGVARLPAGRQGVRAGGARAAALRGRARARAGERGKSGAVHRTLLTRQRLVLAARDGGDPFVGVRRRPAR